MTTGLELGCTIVMGFQDPTGKPTTIRVVDNFDTCLKKVMPDVDEKMLGVNGSEEHKSVRRRWTWDLVDGGKFFAHTDAVACIFEGDPFDLD